MQISQMMILRRVLKMLQKENKKGVSTSSEILLNLREWEEASPLTHSELKGINFNKHPEGRALAHQLAQSGQLEIIEQIDGLLIRANSYVGSVHIGPIHLIIQPKITGTPLLNLLRYAYGLRKLVLFPLSNYGIQQFAFQDLLIYQLVMEVEELLSRGLLRHYLRDDRYLSNPTGRINFQKIVSQGGTVSASLPCTNYQRLENCIHNQILLAGLIYASRSTEEIPLRSQIRKLVHVFDLSVTSIHLNWTLLEKVHQESTRLTSSYEPAIIIIELLMEQQGIEQEPSSAKIKLNGFLFDMNRFFQALVSRFLREFLEGFIIEDEHKLSGMMAYIPGYRLNQHPNPTPRPDFAILKDGKVVALLDAKYRDLWQKGLPRDMLYQLSIYSLSQGVGGKATIIYPVVGSPHNDARIAIHDPIYGNIQSSVIMRAIDLVELDGLLLDPDQRKCKNIVNKLVFGIN
jgi:5-methylcytosine-specific restriction enzyme subunit McrC